jgi:hypothetical protein
MLAARDLSARFPFTTVLSAFGARFGAVVGVSALLGCPTPSTTSDTGVPSEDSAVIEPVTPPLTTGTPSNPTEAPADFGCVGSATGPMPGDTVPFTFALRGFGSGDEVRNARIHFFPDNVPTLDCTGSCIEVTTDMMGNAAVMAPANGWYAYHVFFRMGGSAASTYVDSVQINEPAPAASGGMTEGNAVSAGTLALIPAVITGVARPMGTALIAGEVQDCTGTASRGAAIRVYRADGTRILSDWSDGVAPQVRFFDGEENPDDTSEFTQVDGLYAVLNLPAPEDGFDDIRVEAWGVTSEGAEPMLLGCEQVGVYADGVSIVNVGPLRNDYPAGHLCL